MVMKGGGRSREIQGLQSAAAANGGEGTARQQARLQYLQNHKQAGRGPTGPQTGGPLMNAMGPGGQDAIRTQQPWNGVGGRMGNGGTTSDGQPPMTMDGGQAPAYGNLAGQVGQPGGFAAPTQQQIAENQRMQEAMNQRRQELSAGRPGDPSQFAPMQRPTPMQNDQGFAQQFDPAQMERLKLRMQAPRGPNQNPNTIAGQGVGAGRFMPPGQFAPQNSPVGNQFAGGGDPNMNRFSKFGSFVPPARSVEGNQIRGGGSPGLSRRRVDTTAGVLAPPPNRMR